ncbi:MAG: Rho termination factor N-terminal domain-containing protein, partial [Aestuariibaculum sp.]
MFEISQLNEKKLSELHEIAKKLNIPKFRSLKKLDFVYQILDRQAADPKAVKEAAESSKPEQQDRVKTDPKDVKKENKKPRQR